VTFQVVSSRSEVAHFAAVVPAAGAGQRMGSEEKKPYLLLAGEAILAHTVRRLRQARGCARVVIVVHRDEFDAREHLGVRRMGGHAGGDKIVCGGDTRQASVLAGLEAVGADCSLVLIHDAVRPLVSVATIEAVAVEAARTGAAIAAVPCRETVKQVGKDRTIERTRLRGGLWLAQTPQGFETDLIRRAHVCARDEGFVGTDDAQLVERLGHKVSVVEGERSNIKITTPDDLAIAEALMAKQQAGSCPSCQ